MRRSLFCLTIVAVATFTGIATWRLSTDVLTLLVGFCIGLVVTIPSTLFSLWLWRRPQPRGDTSSLPHPQTPQVIILPPAAVSSWGKPEAMNRQAMPPPSPQRTWDMHIYGEEGIDAEVEPVSW